MTANRALIIVSAALAALLLVLAFLYFMSVSTIGSISKQSRAWESKAKATSTLLQRERTDLTGCSTAYSEQHAVTADLRDAVSEAFTSLQDYASTYGSATLDSSALVDRIGTINDREQAIDASGCRQ